MLQIDTTQPLFVIKVNKSVLIDAFSLMGEAITFMETTSSSSIE